MRNGVRFKKKKKITARKPNKNISYLDKLVTGNLDLSKRENNSDISGTFFRQDSYFSQMQKSILFPSNCKYLNNLVIKHSRLNNHIRGFEFKFPS